jgi:hypothetical protein
LSIDRNKDHKRTIHINFKLKNMKKAALLILVLIVILIPSCQMKQEDQKQDDPKKVSLNNFIRAETDHMYEAMINNAGSTNAFYHFRTPTPLDKQTVIRMNLDVLYSGGVFDAREGITIDIPEINDDRYFSVEIIDNDHYVVDVIHAPGKHDITADTDFVYIIVRIQLKSPFDPDDVAIVNGLQDQFVVTSKSNQAYEKVNWDKNELDSVRNIALKEATKHNSFKGMMGKKGAVNEKTRYIAAAAGWGLLPPEEAIYLQYQDTLAQLDNAYVATYQVPENKGFWSITVYGDDGYLKSENSYLGSSNVALNEDGSFTVCYGTVEACSSFPNQLDAPKGWNFLMRVYQPVQSVMEGSYQVASAVEQ